MTRRRRLESALGPLLERMLSAATAAARARALLEGALELGQAQGAELWGRASGAWRPHLSLGAVETLPRAERVRALLETGAGEALLRAGELVARPRGGAWALVVGGLPDPSVEDALEALLLVHATLAPPDGETPAPLPSSVPSPD